MKQNLKLTLTAVSILIFCNILSVAASFSTTSISDAFVATGTNSNLSGNNFGGGGALALAAKNLPLGEFQTVLKFNLSDARSSFDTQFGVGRWTPQSVTLQLTASIHNNAIYNEIAAGQFNVSWMQNNSWTEGTGTAGRPTTDGISYNSLLNTYANNTTDQPLGVFAFGGNDSGANTYPLSLTSGVTSGVLTGSDLSLRLFAADNVVSYLFSSRTDALNANRPQLIISVVPEPGIMTLCLLGLTMLWLYRAANLQKIVVKGFASGPRDNNANPLQRNRQ